MVWLWATIFVSTLVVEIFTVELISIWFTVGSFVAFFLALCTGLSAAWQIAIFVLISLVLLICMRKICMKLLKNNKEKTNVDALVDSVHTLTKAISDDAAGEVKVNDVVWRAVSKNGEDIAEKTKVRIVEVKGNKLVVEKEIKEKKGDKKDE